MKPMTPLSSAPDVRWTSPTAIAVAQALGVVDAVDTIAILARDERFLAILPDGRHAWFAQSDAGSDLLAREARVLDLLAAHCRFTAPRMLAVGPGWQLRQPVPGTVDPWGTYRRILSEPGFARATGAALGRVLADQHLNVPRDALRGWLPERPGWPVEHARLAAALPQVVTDPGLVASALAAVAAHEAALAEVPDPVLVHGDLGIHNLTFAPGGELAGVFDYADAALSDRHRDFCYLLFDRLDDTLLAAALEAYGAAGGMPIDKARVALANAACATGFLAYRAGHGPEDRPAGRTLAEDLAWVRLALARLG